MTFAGCVLWAYKLSGSSQLGKLVTQQGGVWREGTTASSAGGGLTHVVVQGASFPDELAFLARMRPRLPGAHFVTRKWVELCIARRALQPEASYAPPPPPLPLPSPSLDAPPSRGAGPSRAERERESTPPRDGAREEAAAIPFAFTPPPPSGELCQRCRQLLAWCEIQTCQRCLKVVAPSAFVAQTRALHLRFRVQHPNVELVKCLLELADYEELFGSEHAKMSSTTFAKVAGMLRATPRDILTIDDLAEFDMPYIDASGKTATTYIPQFLRTGRIERLENHRGEPMRVAARSLSKLPYVGPQLAKKWAAAGWHSAEEVMRNLPADERSKLSPWQVLLLSHASDILSDIDAAGRAPLEALMTAAARAAEPSGALTWQLVGGSARGKQGGHDLDFLFSHTAPGGEQGKLERLLRFIADSPLVERDEGGVPKLCVCLSSANLSEGASDGGANARGFASGNVWVPGQGWDKFATADKALMLLKLRGQPLRHLDVLMVPKHEVAMMVCGWVGSRELRKLMNKHAKNVLRCSTAPDPLQYFKLNAQHLRDMRLRPDGEPDLTYQSRLVTRLGVDAPLVAAQDVARDYIGKELYPREEREIWEMLRLPWRPMSDRNA